MLDMISWFFTFLSLFGAFWNSKGSLWVSSWIWLGANIYWFSLDFSRGLYAQSALYIAFIGMNLFGLRTSFKERKNAKERE